MWIERDSASKFGAFGFDESFRIFQNLELKHIKSKVRTTCICPFYINTGIFEGVKAKFPLILPIMRDKNGPQIELLTQFYRMRKFVCYGGCKITFVLLWQELCCQLIYLTIWHFIWV